MVYKIFLLTLLIVASLVSSSFAARCGSSIPMVKLGATDQNQESLHLEDDQVLERDGIIHERLLRANTKDYGRPDPAPTFVKPPFKLIPN
ncbi:protein CASPARIAN STRIP INTEGRITY FACTOR 1-like [Bidens hawaiensis]|uniref:protein CASPARIAN STRIP INTEGRITY FACTOR 1-like n=1 Tax=Bidens hawaiensis TaxID=980011 RepID=UPI004049C80E